MTQTFLSSAYDVVVPAEGKALVKTDIQIQLPSGCYGRVAPRSGLAWKNFINVGGMVLSRTLLFANFFLLDVPTVVAI